VDKKVAVIDLGTNTFHLLIAEWDGRQYQITLRERLPVKIGMGGINYGIITKAGIGRALDALKKFKTTLEDLAVTRVFAFGTSALRNAQNGKEIVSLIQQQTGISIHIISGDEEAEYIYRGVRKALTMGEQTSLIVDIGGGSVEFIIGNDDEIFWKRSFEIGAQRLLEKFQKHDPILPDEVKKLDAYLNENLRPLFKSMNQYKPTVLIGSSGTFDTLSEIHCIRNNIPQPPDAAETPLTFEGFHEIFKELLIKNRVERLQIPGMIEMRVDMIVVACCLIDFLLRHFTFSTIRVSSYSLKEGVLASLEENPDLQQGTT
jgi:exopolyphosphatase/guanosine-5'-triphosphate,3'-diphosphate pyrophosphatase